MGLQIVVGIPLEMTNNSFRVALIYTLGVFGGSLAFGVFDPGNVLLGKYQIKQKYVVENNNTFPTPILGASAGGFALGTAHIASIILNFKEDIAVIRTRIRQKDWKICGRHIKWNKLPTASNCGKGVRYDNNFSLVIIYLDLCNLYTNFYLTSL